MGQAPKVRFAPVGLRGSQEGQGAPRSYLSPVSEKRFVVPLRKASKRGRPKHRLLREAAEPRKRWALKFVANTLVSGRRFRVLQLFGYAPKEALGDGGQTAFPAAAGNAGLGRPRPGPSRFGGHRGGQRSGPSDPPDAQVGGPAWGAALLFVSQKPISNSLIETFHGEARLRHLNQNGFFKSSSGNEVPTRWPHQDSTNRPVLAPENLRAVLFPAELGSALNPDASPRTGFDPLVRMINFPQKDRTYRDPFPVTGSPRAQVPCAGSKIPHEWGVGTFICIKRPRLFEVIQQTLTRSTHNNWRGIRR